jgi:TRAP-type C4-dicarboxylate transport system permease small subunit
MSSNPPTEEQRTTPNRLAQVSATILMSASVLCVALQVLNRYVVHLQTSWTEEVARLLIVWIAGLGAVLSVAADSHFRMDLIVARLKGRARRLADWIVTGVSIAFCLMFGYAGLRFCAGLSDDISPILNIPYSIPMAAIPLCALGMVIFLIRRALALHSASRGASERN